MRKFSSKGPLILSFKVFGCLCYASTWSRNRTKFDHEATACVFFFWISSWHQRVQTLWFGLLHFVTFVNVTMTRISDLQNCRNSHWSLMSTPSCSSITQCTSWAATWTPWDACIVQSSLQEQQTTVIRYINDQFPMAAKSSTI